LSRDLENLFSDVHSHGEYLWYVSLKLRDTARHARYGC